MKLAILLLCMESFSDSINQGQASINEKNYAIEGQAGLLGAGLSVGVLNRAQETYFIKAKFDTYIQSSMASAGLNYQKFFTSSSYFEPGVGAFRSWLDEEGESESSGPYASIALGMQLSGNDKKVQFGIEWTTLSILYSTNKDEAYLNATLPKLTLGTKF
jgi:hypothetical protein